MLDNWGEKEVVVFRQLLNCLHKSDRNWLIASLKDNAKSFDQVLLDEKEHISVVEKYVECNPEMNVWLQLTKPNSTKTDKLKASILLALENLASKQEDAFNGE